MAVWADVAQTAVTATAGLVGVAVGYLGQRLMSNAASEREAAARLAERELRSADYQRQTLHDLQEALTTLLFAAFDAAWPEEGMAQRPLVLAQYGASAAVTMLTQRVEDEVARGAVDEAARAISKLMAADSPTGDEMGRQAREAVDIAQRAMGDALRALP